MKAMAKVMPANNSTASLWLVFFVALFFGVVLACGDGRE